MDTGLDNEGFNIYAGAPEDMAAVVQEAATKSLENEIRSAIDELTRGKQNRYEATIRILGSIVGDR